MLKQVFKKLFADEWSKKIKDAEHEAKAIKLKASEEALRIKQEAERDARKTLNDALLVEKRVANKEKALEEQIEKINRDKKRLESMEQELKQRKKKLLEKLEKIASLKREDARKIILSDWENRLKKDIVQRIKEAEKEIKTTAEEKAKEILVDSMRYGATDYVTEYTLSVIPLPNDDFKGRIIGKDGRNIRAFELATGVDVDLEEEGIIRLSSFDSVRREIARVALEKLIKDGRIQPSRIEEVVAKTRREIEKIMYKAGEELAHKVGVFNLPTEIVKLLGKFKYRYSYGQNMILHTLEETRIGISLAHELKADVGVVKLGCLLHDIGKTIDKEGSHVDLGVELLQKHRFPKKVIGCVAAHHEDVPFPSVEAVIVYIADAVSGGRPGARRENFQDYLKRVKTVEDIAKKYKGVRDAFAVQAGRELRVIVKPEEISDDNATILAEKIRDDLQNKFEVFPGQIKITVIREFRAEQVAKI